MKHLPKSLIIFVFIITIVPFSCKQGKRELDPQAVIDLSIEAHGGNLFENSIVEFDFRNRHYYRSRKGGGFLFSREFKDSLGTIKDVLDNEGLDRFVNDSLVQLSEKKAAAYSSSVNSVIYFALLPYRLNDPAVNKSFLQDEEISGQEYFKVRVTFNEEGGGEDHQDIFIYWINQETFEMDYLAYSYETDGGGIRFRASKNKRRVNGILFQDYENYKEGKKMPPLEGMASSFELGELTLLSKIELENIQVRSGQ